MNCNIENIKKHIESEIKDSLSEKFLTADDPFRNNLGSDTDFSELLQAVSSIVSSGGKRWRAVLTVLCAAACKPTWNPDEQKSIYKLASVIELIHTASLIHDDIEDSSERRRGKPAAHIQFGIDTALNAGSWLYFHALRFFHRIDLPAEKKYRIGELIQQGIYNLHLGQALDISWHRNETFFPPPEQYEKMIRLKTGTLAGLAAGTAVLYANGGSAKSLAASDALHELGIAFQVLDDIKNISTGIAGKDTGDDIVEGKKSLPVIFFVENDTARAEKLVSYFIQAKREGIQSTAVRSALELLNASNCIARAETFARAKITKAKSALTDIFPHGENLDTLLAFLDTLL